MLKIVIGRHADPNMSYLKFESLYSKQNWFKYGTVSYSVHRYHVKKKVQVPISVQAFHNFLCHNKLNFTYEENVSKTEKLDAFTKKFQSNWIHIIFMGKMYYEIGKSLKFWTVKSEKNSDRIRNT